MKIYALLRYLTTSINRTEKKYNISNTEQRIFRNPILTRRPMKNRLI